MPYPPCIHMEGHPFHSHPLPLPYPGRACVHKPRLQDCERLMGFPRGILTIPSSFFMHWFRTQTGWFLGREPARRRPTWNLHSSGSFQFGTVRIQTWACQALKAFHPSLHPMNRANSYPPGASTKVYKVSWNHIVGGKTWQKHKNQWEVNKTFPACYLCDLSMYLTSLISASSGWIMGPIIMSPLCGGPSSWRLEVVIMPTIVLYSRYGAQHLHPLYHLILPAISRIGTLIISSLKGKQTDAQRILVTCPRSHSF